MKPRGITIIVRGRLKVVSVSGSITPAAGRLLANLYGISRGPVLLLLDSTGGDTEACQQVLAAMKRAQGNNSPTAVHVRRAIGPAVLLICGAWLRFASGNSTIGRVPKGKAFRRLLRTSTGEKLTRWAVRRMRDGLLTPEAAEFAELIHTLLPSRVAAAKRVEGILQGESQ